MKNDLRMILVLVASMFFSACGMPERDRVGAKGDTIHFRDRDYSKDDDHSLSILRLSVDMFENGYEWRGESVVIAKDDLVKAIRYYTKGNGDADNIRQKAEVLLGEL